MDITQEFEHVLAAIRDADVAYALCGGFALAAYGIVRATEDIDLLVQAQDLTRLIVLLASLGYLKEKTPLEFQKGRVTLHRFVKPDPESEDFVVVDLLLVGELTRGAWESRRSVESDLGRLVVVAPSGLIALKALRGSGQDMDDIKKLRELE
jgi:Aminoglycoside-2''-adenylyltransferase